MQLTGSKVYLDANVVIEAHRTDCWSALTSCYDLHTTRECLLELGRGNPCDADYVPVDTVNLSRQVTVHNVKATTLASAILCAPRCGGIHLGERELLAHVVTESGKRALLISTADRAAVLAACELKLGDRLVSLEELASQAGTHPALRDWFSKRWLSRVKTDALLDGLGL